MSARIRASVSPRQSPSSAILASINRESVGRLTLRVVLLRAHSRALLRNHEIAKFPAA